MHYHEIKKIRRETDSHMYCETIIATDLQKFLFKSTDGRDKPNLSKTTFQISRTYGAGLHLSIARYTGKRHIEHDIELGKSEVKMLIDYLTLVYPELRDYNGTYVPVELLDFRRQRAKDEPQNNPHA